MIGVPVTAIFLSFFALFSSGFYKLFLTLNITPKKNGIFFVNKFAFLKGLCYNDRRGNFDFRQNIIKP